MSKAIQSEFGQKQKTDELQMKPLNCINYLDEMKRNKTTSLHEKKDKFT